VNRAIATVRAGNMSSTFSIKLWSDDQLPLLNTDPDRLGQVFINLIANARKYCDAQQPELIITLRHKQGQFIADFVDNGSGVPKDDQELIFEKFARVGENKAGGAGLGLAICREIIGRLSGEISYLPGQRGGAFRIILPISTKP